MYSQDFEKIDIQLNNNKKIINNSKNNITQNEIYIDESEKTNYPQNSIRNDRIDQANLY